MSFSRAYSTQQQPPPSSKDDGADKPVVPIQERAVATIQNLTDLGKQWGQKSVSTASNTVNYWWERYEEFVGLNEVRDAQSQVTEVSPYGRQVRKLKVVVFFSNSISLFHHLRLSFS